ncbi:MAG TPA: hypothetical protein VE326_08415 [Candidatus Binatia bacterium]|nr:hypothetical protein [Candidatus Binatia bacterium]
MRSGNSCSAARAIPLAAAALLLTGGMSVARASWPPLALVSGSPVLAQAAIGPADATMAAGGSAAVSTGAAAASERLRRADEQPRRGGKKAVLLSLLLPGAGEMSLGARGRATGFFIAEGAIWTHFVWFQVAGHLRKDNYIEQAQLHAGVGVSSADDTYWKLLGQYQTSQGTGPTAYEEALRREARDNFPSDPAAQDAYVAERLPSGDRAWSWSSADAQTSYRATRESSRRAFDRSKYSIAAAIANRLLSAIDTQIVRGRSGERHSAREVPGIPLLLLADTAPDGSGRLYLTRSF